MMLTYDHRKSYQDNIKTGGNSDMAGIKKMGYCVNGEWKSSKSDKYMDVTDSVRVR